MKKYLNKFDKQTGFSISENKLVLEYLTAHYAEMEEEDMEDDFETSLDYHNSYKDDESVQHNIETLACLWCGLISVPFDTNLCNSEDYYILKVDLFSKRLNCYLLNDDKETANQLTPLITPTLTDLPAANAQFIEMTFSYGDYELNKTDDKIKQEIISYKQQFPLVYNFFLENYKQTFKGLITDAVDPKLFIYHKLYEVALYHSTVYFKSKPSARPQQLTNLENSKPDPENIPMVFLKLLSLKKNQGDRGEIDTLSAIVKNSKIKFYIDWLKKI
jgi:hypothetical protein